MTTHSEVFQWDPIRIDTWLRQTFGQSRNFFHHLIRRWAIFCNNTVVKKSYMLQRWDIVYIEDLRRHTWPWLLEECAYIPLSIVYETTDYCIIDKPKWVVSHPSSIRDTTTPSVVAFLYHHFKKTLPTVSHFIRAWLVHRLDKWTDWFMIIAKTEKALAYFKWLFQQKSLADTIELKEQVPLVKRYTAIVDVTKKWHTFLHDIVDKIPYYIIKTVVPLVPHSIPKLGISKIIAAQQHWTHAHCTIEILTWRTHQIRFHLASEGLPIQWDYLYGLEKYKKKKTDLQLSASYLSFVDYDGKSQVFSK